jgi:hypothetical protein
MSNPKTIKEIIIDFKNKYGLSGLWSQPTGYMEYEDKTDEVVNDVSLALLSLLDEVEKRAKNITPAYDGDALDTNNNRRWYDQGFGEFKSEFIKLINELREK